MELYDGADGSAADIEWFAGAFRAIVASIGNVVAGKTEQITQAVTCLLAGGHLLIEDVPGVGKTSLARCIAESIDGTCRRLQFTPDLLPSDITGVTIYHQRRQEFEFHPGPVFSNIVICDEINRASPKTQAALLEVMGESHVSVDGITHPVPFPFMVVATQNPVDLDGTYALPEAQLDRFLLCIHLGYPDEDTEMGILTGAAPDSHQRRVSRVLTGEEVSTMMRVGSRVQATEEIRRYAVRLVAATRSRADVRLGASPRGSIALLRAAQVRAAACGREFAIPEDIQALAIPVLAHRIMLSLDAELADLKAIDIVEDLLRSVPVPRSVARL
jgi:MoxR-like ATPase